MRNSRIVAAGFVAAVLCGCASGPAGVRPMVRNDAGQEPTVSGTRDLITITFQLSDRDLTQASVRVEYEEGGVWYDATLTRPSPGTVVGPAKVYAERHCVAGDEARPGAPPPQYSAPVGGYDAIWAGSRGALFGHPGAPKRRDTYRLWQHGV